MLCSVSYTAQVGVRDQVCFRQWLSVERIGLSHTHVCAGGLVDERMFAGEWAEVIALS